MLLSQLLLLYLIAGAGVAIAVYLSSQANHAAEKWFELLSALLFWPLYLPLLLSPSRRETERPAQGPVSPPDELSRIIDQVDAELEGALRSLDGWAEEVLAREEDRLHELRHIWCSQADRIRQMDQLLSQPNRSNLTESFRHTRVEGDNAERMQHSERVIQQNIERLQMVRQKALADLLATLAWVRELVSMIHLAKFTGAPAAQAEELVAQIAAAVEGLSAVTWQSDSLKTQDNSGTTEISITAEPSASPLRP